MGRRLCGCGPGLAVRAHPGSQLHGHQAAAGPDVRQGRVHDQGQDTRPDPQNVRSFRLGCFFTCMPICQKIRFNITNDFTPEEEEAVRAENKWAEES